MKPAGRDIPISPHPTDFEIADGEWFGEWLHGEIASSAFLEQRGAMPERVRAVAARLQVSRPEHERFVVEVPWIRAISAFTAPGRFIYFGRRLLERCPDEETTAFVIAHEMAHHDLGHLGLFRGRFARRVATLKVGVAAVLFFRILQKRIYSPEWELAADRRAIELCVAAGYDGARCLRLFHILELIALDFGHLNMVYGLDAESDQELSPEASLVTKARIWLWQRKHGYLPLQDRGAMAWKHLGEITGSAVRPPRG